MSPTRARPVARRFYLRDSLVVAPELLNKVMVAGERRGRIVEVEAYRGSEDPASHAFRGRTDRNRTMFGPPGHLYVYFTYGMHWCSNAVCMPDGVAQAVLIRALAPLGGLDSMWAARPAARAERDLCRGPARLCQALGIDRRHDGADLVAADHGIAILDDGVPPPDRPGRGPRVGINVAADLPWRWWVSGDPNVSGRSVPYGPPGARSVRPTSRRGGTSGVAGRR